MNQKLEKTYFSVINDSNLAWLKLDTDFSHEKIHQEWQQAPNRSSNPSCEQASTCEPLIHKKPNKRYKN